MQRPPPVKPRTYTNLQYPITGKIYGRLTFIVK